MLRRLYYLFPDIDHTQSVVDELVSLNVPRHRMHAMARKNIDLHSLPGATSKQKSDSMHHIVRLVWNVNLLLFFLALIALFAGLYVESTLLAIVSILVMAATFIGGYLYATHLPDMDMSDFENALAHGEILLMVDVPLKQVEAIESHMHHKHFEAYDGGISWTVGAFGL